MTKELKIFALVVAVIAVIYVGVEPLAHSVMHKKVAKADFTFSDLSDFVSVQDPAPGHELVVNNCASCHGVAAAGIAAPFDAAGASDAFGVVPPDLSNVGATLDPKFLANFIKDPVKATLLTHKFKQSCDGAPDLEACEKSNENKADYPMNAFAGVLSDEEISQIVVYLQHIAPKNLSDKDVFLASCARCHGASYDGISVASDPKALENYLGATAPDLSIAIRAKGRDYLQKFINNPQHELPGTSMPRVGLSESAQTKVINFLESVGDRKKPERDALGWKIMAFFAVMSVLAFLWKKKIWRDVH